jgi:translation initiation factor IF-2
LDPQKGPVATVLVRTGTLKVGQDIVSGASFGRIRNIEDWNGRKLEQAGPSVPAIIYGFNASPQVNNIVQVVSGKSLAREKSEKAEIKKFSRITGGH